ncbi:Remorin family protein [Striga hermonthica]|uniref:Remorin family protein n=1 Tax=Striga hermonthica TaxID=68872 RepID=A0A9N7NRM0_STRHE|nr:Remorin family protein [Striga hermonthica]
MAEAEPKKAVPQSKPEPELEAPPAAEAEPVEAPKDVTEEKTVTPPPPTEEKADDCKALVTVEKPAAASEEKKSEGGSINRDAVLARVATEKRLSLVRAWEESEKCKAENKAQKELSAIGAWENSKKASLEAELKKIEENLEKKKAKYIEAMKNKIALIHKEAEEKRAIIEAKRGEDLLKAEETAAKYRATGTAPKKLLGCF